MEDSSLVRFNFEGAEVRTVVNGETVWIVAKDICDYFGDTDHKRSISYLDDDEKMLVPIIDSLGRTQQAYAVNDCGLIRLLLEFNPQKNGGANLPPHIIERRKRINVFKRWAIHEVLQPYVKHGIVATPQTVESMIADPDTMIQTLQALKTERALRIEAERARLEAESKRAQISTKREASVMGKLSGAIRNNDILREENERLEEELEDAKGEGNYMNVAEIKWLKDYIVVSKAHNAVGRIMTSISNSNKLDSSKHRNIMGRHGKPIAIKVYHADAWVILKNMLDNDPLTLYNYRRRKPDVIQDTLF